MTTPPKQLQVPKKSLGDAAIELIRAVWSGIPAAGIFASLIKTNQEIETGFFLEEVARRINALDQPPEESLFAKANLGDDKAAEIIVKSWRGLAGAFAEAHDERKKEALKAAACSVALTTGVGERASVEHDFFMKLVRQLDGIHIRLLKAARYINDVKEIVYSIDGDNRAGLVLEGRNPFTPKPGIKAWKELYDYGLVNTDSVDTHMTDAGYEIDNRTPMGALFLQFITSDADC